MAIEAKEVVLTNGIFGVNLTIGCVAVETKECWLETGVWSSGRAESYMRLVPHEKLTPILSAIFAQP